MRSQHATQRAKSQRHPEQPIQVSAPASAPVDVFVSYSHKDKFWKDWLLGGRLSAGTATIGFWSDDEIRPSNDWNNEIKDSLERAKVAVLLVSKSFLESRFIRNIELPGILKQREAKRAKILWVPLEPHMGKLAETALPGIEGVWPVDSPLKIILETQPADMLTAARDRIHDYILRELNPELWRVRRLFREEYDKYEVIRWMGEGSSQSVYLGRDHTLKRFVSIVILKRSEELGDFQASLLDAGAVEDLEAFMTVYEAGLNSNPPFYVRQYIEGQTLHQQLQSGSLSFRQARDILLRLGKALDAAHRRDFFHLNIKPSNIMVGPRDAVYLSALSREPKYFEWLKKNWGAQGADAPRDEDYAYAIPEFFRGQVVPRESFAQCDQYLLGLLGYHTITGKVPLREGMSWKRLPKSPAAFGALRQIHEFEGCRLCPKALGDTIIRMASPEPSNRFDSVGDALRRLAQFGEESLTVAKESYRRVAALDSWKDKVLREFYDKLIPQLKSKKAREMFKRMEWKRQYEMLAEAILLLLVFCEFDTPEPKEPTVLSRIGARHSNLDLEAGDLDLFQTLLIDTVVRHDPGCTDEVVSEEVKQAWRKSLQPGIEFMKRHVSR